MKQPEVLVIDDEIEVGAFFEYYLKEERKYPVTVANSGKQAKAILRDKTFDLALVDLRLPDTDGISLLKKIKERNPACEVIIITGYSTVKSAVEAMRLGAFDYIEKPFDELEELDNLLDRALRMINNRQQFINEELGRLASEFGIVMGVGSPLQELLILCKKVANRKISILIEGETGTGKEVLARFIHTNSPRAKYPFVGVNCGALTETLLESELFGHEKGAFTGALGVRRGIFEIANNGTLFLDEIGEATPSIQVKLLRVLESGEFFRVGGEKPIKSDVRVIAATNRSLRVAVKEKLFREELFYRLEVFDLQIPPLRERRMDILPLVNYFIKQNLPEEEKHLEVEFTPQAAELLQNYHWPGNVRELSNVVARAMALRGSGVLDLDSLPEHIRLFGELVSGEASLGLQSSVEEIVREWARLLLKTLLKRDKLNLLELSQVLKNETDTLTRGIIQAALDKTGNNKLEASKLLSINPRVLRYLKNEKGRK